MFGDGIDLSGSRIQINFPGGTMLASDGTPYISTTSNYDLDTP